MTTYLEDDFRLGKWIIRSQRRVIENDDGEVHITPKSMAVLACLAGSGGAPISRGEVLDTVWPGAEITDDVLTGCISELRKAFGDSARNPQVIETIPKMGFRLLPDVKPLSETVISPDAAELPVELKNRERVPTAVETPATASTQSTNRWHRLAVVVAAILLIVLLSFESTRNWLTDGMASGIPTMDNGIAVLPFSDMSPGGDHQWLGDGMAEDVIDMLARVDGLRVIARTSAFVMRDTDIRTVGRELGVPWVIEGSVRPSGEQMRITVQLINAENGSHLWSAHYDEPMSDILSVQQTVAREVAQAVHDTLGIELPSNQRRARFQTRDPRAYELVARAQVMRRAWTEESMREALDLNQQALAIDPDYGWAHAENGWSNFVLAEFRPDQFRELRSRAKAAGERALELEPATGAAYNLLAELAASAGDWITAEEYWQTGLAVAPGHGIMRMYYGMHLLRTDRREEARVNLLRALELDPKAPVMHRTAGHLYMMDENYPLAIEQFQLAYGDFPDKTNLAHAYYLSGADLRAALVLAGLFPPADLFGVGVVFLKQGYPGVMKALIDNMNKPSGKACGNFPSWTALLFAMIREADSMFQCLDEVDPGDNENKSGPISVLGLPAFDPYRDDPRFIAAVNRVIPGFPLGGQTH